MLVPPHFLGSTSFKKIIWQYESGKKSFPIIILVLSPTVLSFFMEIAGYTCRRLDACEFTQVLSVA